MLKFSIFLLSIFTGLIIQAQTSNNNSSTLSLSVQTNNQPAKTITLDFTELHQGLQELGKTLEGLGNEIDALMEEISETPIEVIQVDKTGKDLKIKVSKTEKGSKNEFELEGKEAEKYLENLENQFTSSKKVNMNGSFQFSDENEESENYQLEIKVAEISTDKSDHQSQKKVLVIKKYSKD